LGVFNLSSEQKNDDLMDASFRAVVLKLFFVKHWCVATLDVICVYNSKKQQVAC
jgi:hypothetical protein